MEFLRAATQPPAGCREAAAARAAAPARAPLLLALLAGLLALAAMRALHDVPREGAAPRREQLSQLPRGAREAASAALGGELPGYALGAERGGFAAGNPSQRLQLRFAGAGLQIAAGETLVGIRPSAIGHGGSLQRLGAVRTSASANRVSYAGAGLAGWYANGPLGVEQGFIIARAPGGAAGKTLTLSMALTGNARAVLEAGGQSVRFSHAGSPRLRYSSLLVSDARGEMLRARLQLAPRRLLLQIDAQHARYPLRIDPLIQQGEKLAGSEEVGSLILFGQSAALSADGSTALVGGPFDDGGLGAGWVFTRSGSSWSQQGPKLTAPGQGKGFGTSVALSSDGNTALVGGDGAALVFTRSGAGWAQQGEALRGSGESAKVTGAGVALSADGNTALLGGPTGTAWVFTRSGSTWTQQGAVLAGSGAEAGSESGSSVALSAAGDTALIGGGAAGGGIGAAWIFTRSGATWTQQGAALTGGQESGRGEFGTATTLSADGDTALIGGPGDGGDLGAAWAFTRNGTEWSEQGEKLTGAGELSEAFFGCSVALSAGGETALVGGRDEGTVGAVWVLAHDRSGWSEQASRLSGGGEVGHSSFGSSVALSADGGTALIGGHGDDQFIGAAWVFANLPTPTVRRLSSREGPASGETLVTISGTNLLGATAVDFGATAASSFLVRSATSITAVSPAAAGGRVNVTVSTVDGTSATSTRDRYTFKPLVTGVSPESSAGGARVIVTGAGFIPGSGTSSFRFGSRRAASVDCSSSSACTVTVPGRRGGTVHVRSTVNGVVSARNQPGDTFTYAE